MHQITVSPAHLKAALQAAAKQDVRYYLNGLLIQATPTETRVVGTDGHMLIALRQAAQNSVTGQVDIIIPREVLDRLKPSKRELTTAQYTVSVPDTGPCSIQAGNSTEYFTPVDGKFPDYVRVIPEKVSGQAGNFNPALLSRAQAAADIVTGKSAVTHFAQNGAEQAGLFTCAVPGFLAVVMPIRPPKDFSPQSTAWARQPLAA